MPAAAPSTADTTGHGAQQLHVGVGEAVGVGQVRAAQGLEAADAAAGGVEQADVGHAPRQGPAGGVQLLAETAVRTARRPAPDGEVAGRHHHLAALDAAQALDLALGAELLEPAVVGVGALAPQRAELLERARIGQQRQALADGLLAPAVLAGDALGPAQLGGHAPGGARARRSRASSSWPFSTPRRGHRTSLARRVDGHQGSGVSRRRRGGVPRSPGGRRPDATAAVPRCGRSGRAATMAGRAIWASSRDTAAPGQT